MAVDHDDATPPGHPVPSCGTPVRGRLGFVLAELGSLWRELRARRSGTRPTGGAR